MFDDRGYCKACGSQSNIRKSPDVLPSSPDKIVAILKQPEDTWARLIQPFVDDLSYPLGLAATCGFNLNDALGSIVMFYKPPGYGAGVHEEFASNADYILRYTITVVPPPNRDQKKTVLDTGNNFSLN